MRAEPVRLVGGAEDPAMVGLGEVVIFGGHPEDGHGGDAGGGELAGQFDGGEGLVEGITGTAEEADLLAGDDGDGGGVGERVEGGRRGIDAAQGGDDGATAVVGNASQGRGLADGVGVVGVVAVEGLDAVEIVEIVAEEGRRPGERGMGDALSFQHRRDGSFRL